MTSASFLTWLKTPVFPEATAPAPAGPPPPAPPPPAAPAPAPAPGAPAAPAPAPDPGDSSWRLTVVLRAVIAAIASAIGVVGLAVLVGGAVTWLRLSQFGLPTQTALSVMERNDLVTLGATGLVIYVGLAIVLVALLFAADPTGRVTGLTLLLLLAVAIAALIYVLAAAFSSTSRVIVIAVIAALVALCLRVGPATDSRFLPFGVAVFFSVLLFAAVTTYRFEADHPKVQPAAIAQAEGPGVIGFFITASDDRIYLARLKRGKQPAALYDFKRDSTTQLAVGPRMECDPGQAASRSCLKAAAAATALRKRLTVDRRRMAARPTPKAKPKKKPS